MLACTQYVCRSISNAAKRSFNDSVLVCACCAGIFSNIIASRHGTERAPMTCARALTEHHHHIIIATYCARTRSRLCVDCAFLGATPKAPRRIMINGYDVGSIGAVGVLVGWFVCRRRRKSIGHLFQAMPALFTPTGCLPI